MSVYDKHGICEMSDNGSRKSSQVHAAISDYATGRPAADRSYYMDDTSAIFESQAGSSSTSYEGNAEQALYGSGSSFQACAMYNTTQSGFDGYGARKLLEVESSSPIRGNRGTQVKIHLRSRYNLLADPPLVTSVIFGLRRVPASLDRLETLGSHYEFVATVCAPSFSETSSSNTQLQLQLLFQEQSGQDAGLLNAGHFRYIASVLGSSSQLHEGSRKRKLSEPSFPSTQIIDDTSFVSGATYAYPQSLHSVDANSLQRRYEPYGRAQSEIRDVTAQRGTLGLSMDSTTTSLMCPPHSQSTTCSPSCSVGNSTGRSSAVDGTSTSSAPLVRTFASTAFNPFPMYGQKAVLKLRGNLNSMAENWTPEEWTAKRRLVQFFRSRDGCAVNAQFAPVKPKDRQPNSITMSCIWWEERRECFATSVDTIALLEQLVDNRFTVEEKNRIRRNLEGFKPLTVAKNKADSEEFFKVIMGFPNPKPRNIEKDVKVFEWKILAGALKKIMSKYAASQSSTVGPLQGPRASILIGDQTDASADRFNRTTSRSASNSTASSCFAPTLISNVPSPNDTMSSLQYADTSTSAPLSARGHSYVSPSLPTHFEPDDHVNTSPPIGHLGPNYSDGEAISSLSHSYMASTLDRPRSSDYGDVYSSRYTKRPRASTASGVYQPHDTTSACQQASRSFSEQPDHRPSMQLPSLSEEYAVSAAEQVYVPQSQQSSTPLTASTRGGPYDL